MSSHCEPDTERGGTIPKGDNSTGRGLVGGRCKVERMRSGRALPDRSVEAGLRVRFFNDLVQPWTWGRRAAAQTITLVLFLRLHRKSSEKQVRAVWGCVWQEGLGLNGFTNEKLILAAGC